MDSSRLLKFVSGTEQFTLLLPGDGQEQPMVIPSEMNVADIADPARVLPADASVKYVAVGDTLQTAHLYPQTGLRASNVGLVTSTSSTNTSNLWSDKLDSTPKAAKITADNMTRWLQHAEFETRKISSPLTQQQVDMGRVPESVLPSTTNLIRLERTKDIEPNPQTNIPLTAHLETETQKNKVVPIILNHSQVLQFSEADTTKSSSTDFPVDLRNVILLRNSQSDNQSAGINILSKYQTQNQSVTETGPSVSSSKNRPSYSVVSPVYKSKLEKAVAQNQTIALSQGIAHSSVTKNTQGTLKRLLNSNDSDIVGRPVPVASGSQFCVTNDLSSTQDTLKRTLNPTECQELPFEYNGGQWTFDNRKLIDNLSSQIGGSHGNNTAVQPRIISDSNRQVEIVGDARRNTDMKNVSENANSTAVAEYYKKMVSTNKTTIIPNQFTSGSQSLPDDPQPQSGLQPHSDFNMVVTESMEHLTPYKELEKLGDDDFAVLDKNFKITAMYSKNKLVAPISMGTPTVLPLQKDELQQDMLKEKEYEDTTLGKFVLDGLWKLRQNDLFCDAILFVGEQEIKLHKIVLSALSPEVYKKAQKSADVTLKLVLPPDIKYENVISFVSYIYQGRLKLTVGNVQQLYRLSAVFAMDQLSKFCYDFCKLSKMGHLIISSPYQEAAKQVNASSPPVNASSAQCPKHAKQAAEMGTSKVSFLSLDLPSPSVKQTPVNKQIAKKEMNSLEIDWMTSDPTQSNIPIRKRGRTRKGLVENGSNTNINVQVDTKHEEMVGISDNTNSAIIRSENISATSEIKISMNDTVVKKGESESATGIEISKEEKVYPYVARKDKFRRRQMAEEMREKSIVEFPDPLATGQFDASELLKLQSVDKPVLEKVSKVASTKSMVTRFRGRPKNMTVLEAASNKKARNNDTAAVFSSPASKAVKGKTKITKKAVKSMKQKVVTKSQKEVKWYQLPENTDIDKEVASISTNASCKIPEKAPLVPDAVTNELIKFEAGKDFRILNVNPSYSDNVDDKIIEGQKELPIDAEQCNTGSVSTSQDTATSLSESLKVGAPAKTITEAASPPKKARLRKSTLEQQDDTPLKDTVYMRPPPKKRAKEIREMMKNEADIEKEKTAIKMQVASSTDNKSDVIDPMTTENEVVDEKESVEKKPVLKKSRKGSIKDEILTRIIKNVEETGKYVEGDKQYRCCLCRNNFIFARRAITHLVSTHDVEVEETIDYISVEHRNVEKKVCDICGYQTKEVNIYYIHFHKYFRHGVPLPKGWHPFTCDLCKKEFFTKFQLREHKLIHFEDNPFVCEHCGSGFKSRTCLNSHVFHKHSTVRRHKCADCKKTFKTRTQMKVHRRTHTGEKPFKCPDSQCLYRSTTRGNMRLHLVNRHKFATDTIKEIMNALEAAPVEINDAGIEVWVEDMEDANDSAHPLSIGQPMSEQEVTMDANVDALETLVEAAAAEVANATGGYVHVPPHMADDVTSSEPGVISGAVQDINPTEVLSQNQMIQSHAAERGYDISTSVTQSSNIGSSLSIVETHMDDHNIPRHVQMLIQATDDVGQSSHILTVQPDAQEQILHEYHPNSAGQDTADIIPINTYRHQNAMQQSFNDDGSLDPRLITHQQVSHKSRVLDPQSREARMMVKEALQGHEPRSLLKTTILHGTIENQKPVFENVTATDNHMVQAAQMYPEPRNLIPESINQEHTILTSEIMHNLKSQTHEQYRGDNSNMFTGEHPDSHLTFQPHSQSQAQTMDAAHGLQVYHHQVSSSPPAYNATSHGIISIPISEITPTMAKNMFSASIEQGQIQGHSVQVSSVPQQNPGFDNTVTQPSETHYESGNNNLHQVYSGFYQNYQNY